MLNNILYKIKEKIEFDKVDKGILASSMLLVIIGFFSFISASIGFLNKVENEQFFTNFIKMQMLSYSIGVIFLFVAYFISMNLIIRYSKYLYFFSIILCLLIFIPGLEIAHGGGVRWINILGFSMQPADILKLSSILFFSVYFAKYKNKLYTSKYGLLLPTVFAIPVAIVFFLQKDLGSLAIIFFIIGGLYILNKTRSSYIIIAILSAIILVGLYAFSNKYVMERIQGMKEESYQTRQSLISLGSGGLLGRGYGQSIQKFFHLPEPAGDSIFAVVGEEMGFLGTFTVSLLFFILIIRSFLIAHKVNSITYKNIIYGIILLYFAQFVMNTGSMTKIIPLSGDTLPFFSKGGTAIIINLLELGILLKLTRKDNLSKS